MNLIEHDSVNPICPFCKKEMSDIYMKELKGFLGKRYIYFCPACRSILGVSHRKGFWMG